jgi:PAS domain S-box-containing protein
MTTPMATVARSTRALRAVTTAADALAASRAIVESLPAAGVIVADVDLVALHLEGSLFARHGYDIDALCGQPLSEGLGPVAWAELGPRYRAALAGQDQSFDYRGQGGVHWIQIAPVRADDGDVTAVVAVVQDITERASVSEALVRSESRLREAERMVGVGSFELELASGLIGSSEGFRRLLGLAVDDELQLDAYMKMVHADDRDRVARIIADVVATKGSDECEYRIVRADGVELILSVEGEIVTGDDGRALLLRGAALDVTELRQSERERLEAESLFRRGFDGAPIGMVIVDPMEERFVQVNDAMCSLLGRTREELTGLGIADVTHPHDRAVVGQAHRALVDGDATSYQTEKRYHHADGSTVWVALHITPVRPTAGAGWRFFEQVIDITDRKRREAQLEREGADAVWLRRIRDAIDQDRLVLYSQPIVDMTSGETVQQELLLRMRGEDGSIIGPGDFLPVAERYGLMGEIDRWVIRQATALAATGVPVEFNLSGSSIGDPVVLREIETAIAATGVDPSLLVVEVTETAMMDRIEAGRAFAERLTELGCGLALDDFGTGFASLSYLKHLPAQHLKIDIEFVQDVGNEEGARMVRGILGLAREFGLTTTAEGVEDEETRVTLRELGVDRAQGYLFARPGPLG